MKCHLHHTSQPHDSLRLPRKSHFHTSKPAQSTAPATKSDNVISCELQQNLHHTTRLELFRPVLSTLPSTKITISAETCHENSASMPHPGAQTPMARPHPTPKKHDSPNANPNGIPTQTCHFHETLRLCSEMHHVSCATCHFHANHNVIAAQTDT